MDVYDYCLSIISSMGWSQNDGIWCIWLLTLKTNQDSIYHLQASDFK